MGYESNLPEFCATLDEFAQSWTQNHPDTPLEQILTDQANKLCCSDFGPGNQGLFQEAARQTPAAPELMNLPEQLGWRIKRSNRPIFTSDGDSKILRTVKQRYRVTKKGDIVQRKGRVEGEINRRIRHRFYQAVGWLTPRLGRYSGARAGIDRAGVIADLSGQIITIAITNFSTMAGEVAARTGYLARAIEARIVDMHAYIQRKLDEDVAAVNAKHLPPPK